MLMKNIYNVQSSIIYSTIDICGQKRSGGLLCEKNNGWKGTVKMKAVITRLEWFLNKTCNEVTITSQIEIKLKKGESFQIKL